jgi:RNA pol II promoter Fmp27 protein domain
MVDELHVDMHQREEEALVPGPVPGTTRVARRKPFSAAQVVLKGLDMRALVAVFDDPLKKEIPMAASQQRSNYRKHTDLPPIPPSSQWHDMNDFIELDWRPTADPELHLMPVVTCPRFSYSKQASSQGQSQSRAPKFGSEDSHVCLLDKEPCEFSINAL